MARTAWLAVALLVAFGSGGCALHSVAQRANLMAKKTRLLPETLNERLGATREKSALEPTEPYWPFRLAQLYLGADSLERAENALKDAIRKDAHYAPALSLLSKIYFDEARHEEGIRLLEGALADPGGFPNGVPPGLAADLALHYDAVNRVDRARAVMSGVHDDTGGIEPARVFLTLRGSHPDSASALAIAAVKDDGKSAVNQNNYGIALLRSGDAIGARRAFLKAIDLDARLAGPFYNLAILDEFYIFDDEAALGWFKAYRERSREDPDSLTAVFEKIGSRKLVQKEGEP